MRTDCLRPIVRALVGVRRPGRCANRVSHSAGDAVLLGAPAASRRLLFEEARRGRCDCSHVFGRLCRQTHRWALFHEEASDWREEAGEHCEGARDEATRFVYR